VRTALSGIELEGHTVIAGLGGRPITRKSLRGLFESADRGELGELTFLDLNHELVERELLRAQDGGLPGPHAESMVRELGVVAAGSH
jgi:pyruvate ferredoxin oxidoreductase alpha subunit